MNAFEDGDVIVMDVAEVDEPSVINSFYLENLESAPFPAIDGELRRYRVLVSGDTIERETLYANGITLPRISPGRKT